LDAQYPIEAWNDYLKYTRLMGEKRVGPRLRYSGIARATTTLHSGESVTYKMGILVLDRIDISLGQWRERYSRNKKAVTAGEKLWKSTVQRMVSTGFVSADLMDMSDNNVMLNITKDGVPTALFIIDWGMVEPVDTQLKKDDYLARLGNLIHN